MTWKVLITAVALGSAAMAAAPASAMPVDNLAGATSNVEQVRWVCGPFRCWWRPGPRYYGDYGYDYGPRFYGHRFFGPRFRHWEY